jgi:hypothetical protein
MKHHSPASVAVRVGNIHNITGSPPLSHKKKMEGKENKEYVNGERFLSHFTFL